MLSRFARRSTQPDRTHFSTRRTAAAVFGRWSTMLLLVLAAHAVGAATIVVDSEEDNADAGDEACTLREAIHNANDNADTTGGDCVAGSSSDIDRIEFDLVLFPSEIVLQSALPAISDPVVIDGHHDDECTAAIPDRGTYAVVLDGAFTSNADGLALGRDSDGSTIRGLNIRNFTYGITVSKSEDHVFECNFIGTSEDGQSDLGNTIGILVTASANVTIGGTAPGSGNLISGNQSGIWFFRHEQRVGRHKIFGNFIGTDRSGSSSLRNTLGGIEITGGVQEVTIGGAEEGEGNLISNNSTGILITHEFYPPDPSEGVVPTGGHVIQGNKIGTRLDGTPDRGNHIGIEIRGATDTLIGGTSPGEGNVIVESRDQGVLVVDDATGIRISGNAIFENGELGIDLEGNGLTRNDDLDVDVGTNLRQNYPVIESFTRTDDQMVVRFSVPSDSIYQSYPLQVEFFAADIDGEEGQTYLGRVNYSLANAEKTITASFASTQAVSVGDLIVATATDADGNTSEFSPAFAAGALADCLRVENTEDAGLGSLRYALTCANADPARNTIDFQFVNIDSGVIRPSTPLPTITDAVVIDGSTQTGGQNPCTRAVHDRFSPYRVAIDGEGAAFDGLTLGPGSNGSLIKGLNIRGFVAGITIRQSLGNTVACNFIGTDSTGETAQPNGVGVLIDSAPLNVIGGREAQDGNLISGNDVGIMLTGETSTSNRIEGNQIGTDRQGNQALANNFGVQLLNLASSNAIGGPASTAGNLISGNTQAGVYLLGDVTGNLVAGNRIGTDRLAAGPLANGNGVFILGASGNTVGGLGAFAANTIAYNLADGVAVINFMASATSNALLSNAIFENGDLGIDLKLNTAIDDGVTPNDADDDDGDPNRRQNFPDLASAELGASGLEIAYSVDTAPENATYPLRIEFFLADADDEEGRNYLGSDEYTEAQAQSSAVSTILPLAAVTGGDRIVATATDADGNTSEFSTSAATVVDRRVDLRVTIAGSVDPVVSGSGARNLTYVLSVINTGPVTATGIELSTDLALLVGVTEELIPGPGTSLAAAGDSAWTWTVGALAPGAVATLAAHLTVGESVMPGVDAIGMTASVLDVDQDDTNPSNDSASVATSIEAPVDLTVSVSESEDPARAGSGDGAFEYTVDIHNRGPAAATSVALDVTLTLPPGVTLHEATASRGTYTAPTWTIATLNPSFSARLTLALTLDASVADAVDVMQISAAVQAVDQTDLVSSNDQASETTSTQALDCLEVITTADAGLGSLRQAIACANADPDVSTIRFALAGAGPHVIAPATALPAVTVPLILDGTSQPGNEEACEALTLPSFTQQIVIDGGGGDFPGLALDSGSDGSTVIGVHLRNFGGSGIDVVGSHDHRIRCNTIGTDEGGGSDLGNGEHGLSIRSASTGSLVEANLISGNDGNGVLIENDSSSHQVRQNTVAFNAQDGIRVLGDGSIGNTISANRLFDNGQSGIDLSNDGPTANDPGDEDIGPNTLQNTPEIDWVLLGEDGTLDLNYGVDSATAHATYPLTVELFAADAEGEEGAIYLGSVTYTAADAQMNMNASLVPIVSVAPGDAVVATATASDGNTSEFGVARVVRAGADLEVQITESVDPVFAGSGPNNLVYTATVTHLGGLDATGVLLGSDLTLPTGVSVESAVPSAGSFADSTWNLGSLAVGASATLTFTLTVDQGAPEGTDLISAGLTVIASDLADPDPSNDADAEATSIVALSTCLRVTTTDDAGYGSLRQAIECANQVPNANTITFSIPGPGPHVITPASALPRITDEVVIDGTSQPGNETICSLLIPDRPTYQVVLDGQGAGFSGLTLDAGSDGSTVQGLNIRGFKGTGSRGIGGGVWIRSSGGHTVRCNFLGTDATGTAAVDSGHGVHVRSGQANTIGGLAPGDGNLMSGSATADGNGSGVWLERIETTGNRVLGNFIGSDRSGTEALPNQYGITLSGVTANAIGGAVDGAGNLIAGNARDGVLGFQAFDSTIQGNHIGTALDGTSPLPNTEDGVNLGDSSDNVVGGLEDGEGNTIAFNGQAGIVLRAIETVPTGNRFEGNALFDNGGLGIDLNDDGRTPNDIRDGDGSVNRLQNSPAITSVETEGGLTVTYLVESDPANQIYPLQVLFYASDGAGEEGATLVGTDIYREADYGDCGAPPCAKLFDLGAFEGPGLVATATDADGNTSEFSATSPRLVATKIVEVPGGGAAVAGGTLRYTITLSNQGRGPADAVVLTDTPDAATTLVPESIVVVGDITATLDTAGGLVTATLGAPLPGLGGTVTFTYDASIDPGLPAGTHIVCNQAAIDAEGLRPLLTDDPTLPGAEDPTCIDAGAGIDLVLVKDDGGATAVPGASLHYELTYANTGSIDATGVVLTETVPDATRFDAATSAAGWSCAAGGGAGDTCTLALGTVAAMSTPTSIAFAVAVEGPFTRGGPVVVNTASISGDGTGGGDIDPSNNTVTIATPVNLPPTVIGVDTVSSTDDGKLTGGELVLVPVTQIVLIFSEHVLGGDDPTSFLVVEAGGNGVLSTVSCAGGPQGDDLAVAIVDVAYTDRTAYASVSADRALPRGRYRVLACSAAITDAASVPLDGDGDGLPGGDFMIDFRVADTNLLRNPNFDQGLAPWSSLDFDWTNDDVDDAPTSGAGRVILPEGFRLLDHPCITVAGENALGGTLATRTNDGSGGPQIGLIVEFFSGAGCAGSSLGVQRVAATEGGTGGAWISVPSGSAAVPPGAVSARPSVFFDAGASAPSEVLVDRVQLRPMLFGDGFESGNTSAWTATVP